MRRMQTAGRGGKRGGGGGVWWGGQGGRKRGGVLGGEGGPFFGGVFVGELEVFSVLILCPSGPSLAASGGTKKFRAYSTGTSTKGSHWGKLYAKKKKRKTEAA